jgi:dTDP-4-amino-4,6-dideoxygalactose transaminase
LEVRLVDVTPRGQIDASSLARLPLERAAALVVCNLLGVPEPIAPLRELLLGSGVAIVDDAAQSFGAGSDEGAVGGRGDLGVLSFGRGKPLSALGGGALAWRKASDLAAPRVDRPRPLTAACRAAGYDLARVPWVFQALSAIPALGIGDTLYAPDFPRGPIDGASLCLAVGALTALDELTRQRRGRAERLARRLQKRTSFVPLVAESAAFPRLGLVAPSQAVRDVALEALAPLGATRLYPSPIDRIAGLRAHRVGTIPCPGAETFASRLMTLPTHAGLGSHLDAMAATLEGIA